MRNLIIKREKRFVGCLAKLNVYILDECGTTNINNQPCRKLGTLKNGEEKSFAVDERATRIYVIADRLSKGFCSELYELPAGAEDVRLTGRCKYSLISGNAFRFDGQVSAEVLDYRKKTGRRGWVVMIAAVLLGIVIGMLPSWLNQPVKPKNFSAGEFAITLNSDFKPYDHEALFVCYTSGEVVVKVLRESVTDVESAGMKSLTEYGNKLIEVNEIPAELMDEDGLLYFEYGTSDPVEGDHRFTGFVYKSAEAYWYVEFVTRESTADGYANGIRTWAKSVRFTEKTGQQGAA